VIIVEVKIVENKSYKMIGMAIHTLLDEVGRTGPELRVRFEERVHEIINRVTPPTMDYAVSIDPPNYNENTDEFKLMLAVEVDSLDLIPPEMESIELTGTYASVIKTDDSTFGSLFRWVNESGYKLADAYSIEVYDHAKKSIELLFPIVLFK
jgi:predicted transcriptional regulator YdeE